jgi:hypothetical protein
VDIVRRFRGLGVNNHRPTVRACIMIARVVALLNARVEPDDLSFREICRDVLSVDTLKVTADGEPIGGDRVEEIINQVFAPPANKPCSNGTALPLAH